LEPIVNDTTSLFDLRILHQDNKIKVRVTNCLTGCTEHEWEFGRTNDARRDLRLALVGWMMRETQTDTPPYPRPAA
jgi:hypothetical protein